MLPSSTEQRKPRGQRRNSAGDHNFTTHWESALIGEAAPAPYVSPDNPLHLVADLGSVKTINQAVISWYSDATTSHLVDISGQFSLDLSTDGSNYATVYHTTSATGGYSADLPDGKGLVDAIPFTAQPARYVRLTLNGHKGDYLGVWEVQAGNVVAGTPVLSLADALHAFNIAAGVVSASSDDLARLDRDGDHKITLPDVMRINRSIYNL